MKDRTKGRKRGRDPKEPLWVCGVNPVREALSSPGMLMEEILLARSDALSREISEMGAKRSISVRFASKDDLTRTMGHPHHQGVAARMEKYPYGSLETFLKLPPHEREPLVVLDSIQDPQNLGALIRSACFLGARAMVIPADRSAGVTASVMKVAAGGASYLPIIQVVNLARALEQLKEGGLWVMGMTLKESQVIYEVDLTVPLALVVGNEHRGIRPLILEKCDLLVAIPPRGPMESLNAAAAGAVALAEVQRQRLTGFSKV